MEYMKSKNVEVCCFPPHCTHILQPLDDTPFALFKAECQRQLMHVNRLLSGQRIQECTPQMKVLRSSSKQPQVLFLINVSIDWNQIFMLDYVLVSISMFC